MDLNINPSKIGKRVRLDVSYTNEIGENLSASVNLNISSLTPTPSVLPNAINVILLDQNDDRTETINYFYTIEDLRNFIITNNSSRFEVIFGDNMFDILAQHYYPWEYERYGPEQAYFEFEYHEMNCPFGAIGANGANGNVVFLTLCEGFRKIFFRGADLSQNTLCTIGGSLGALRELRLPSTMTEIEDPYNTFSRYSHVRGLWGDNIEKVYINKPEGSISGAPWHMGSFYAPNAQIIWTG